MSTILLSERVSKAFKEWCIKEDGTEIAQWRQIIDAKLNNYVFTTDQFSPFNELTVSDVLDILQHGFEHPKTLEEKVLELYDHYNHIYQTRCAPLDEHNYKVAREFKKLLEEN